MVETLDGAALGGVRGLCARPGGPAGYEDSGGNWGQLWRCDLWKGLGVSTGGRGCRGIVGHCWRLEALWGLEAGIDV